MLLVSGTVAAPVSEVQAQILIVDIIKAAVKKVIKQIDLQVQRLQNKTIALQNAQKTVENAMAKAKLKEISGWMEKQRKLYEEYYQELKKVKSAISTFQGVRNIAAQQAQIVSEYRSAYNAFRQDAHFSPQELAYMYRVYSGIIASSSENLDQLLLVVNSFQTQMTDGKRLELIAAIASRMEHNLSDLRKFTAQNRALSRSRTYEQKDIHNVEKLYGFPDKP